MPIGIGKTEAFEIVMRIGLQDWWGVETGLEWVKEELRVQGAAMSSVFQQVYLWGTRVLKIRPPKGSNKENVFIFSLLTAKAFVIYYRHLDWSKVKIYKDRRIWWRAKQMLRFHFPAVGRLWINKAVTMHSVGLSLAGVTNSFVFLLIS